MSWQTAKFFRMSFIKWVGKSKSDALVVIHTLFCSVMSKHLNCLTQEVQIATLHHRLLIVYEFNATVVALQRFLMLLFLTLILVC